MDVMELLTSTLIQGLIYALISYGVYITYSILDFPDLGVDGTFPLGAAVTAVLMTKGVDPWLTLPASLIVGGLAGLFTGLVHVKLKVRNLLAGIITMTALFSVNLQIAGSNLTIDRGTDTIFTSAPVMALFGDLSLSGRKLIVSLALVIVIKLLLDAYFHTKSGLLLRAVGDNATLVTTLAKDRGTVKILGLVISNALVAFGGCIVCHETRQLLRHHGYRPAGVRPGGGDYRCVHHTLLHRHPAGPGTAEFRAPPLPGFPPGHHGGSAGQCALQAVHPGSHEPGTAHQYDEADYGCTVPAGAGAVRPEGGGDHPCLKYGTSRRSTTPAP